MNGVVIIDKPAGLTSHDVVNRVRRILQQRAVGHLGTLDPIATGVLPLVIGSFTRLAQFYTSAEKVYEGSVRFGFATDTYDCEGEPTTEVKQVSMTRDELESLASHFRGTIEQLPPPFSAKKIHGVPAYKLARKHKEVALQPVQVEIKSLDIVSVEGDRANFRAQVASGTYVRSIAHEMGRLAGCGAHLDALRRTKVAEFSIEDALTLDQLSQCNVPESCFVHPRKLLPELPCVACDDANAARIRTGRTVNLPELSRARQVKVFQGQKELIAIATRVAGTLFHPRIVFVAEVAQQTT
ncbi:MAG TPA: tRNA pseudouridine(55) synthase TruB [Candidatus Sulfotelmatobacter sp.]|nr:tRNA pseudouridine(55) synthase TruB [Candidatus Sulfotelmatobacter sp.]